MENVKSLLTNNTNPMSRLLEETRGLQSKWEKTGLLEGLDGINKGHMSVLLENQAQQLISEATATGTSANSEQWAGVALPLVRRVFAEIAAKEFVSVQPMNLPSGLIFYLDFKYGTNSVAKGASGQSLFGGTLRKLGSTDSAVNGLYGAGEFGYTINHSASVLPALVTASGAWGDVNFDADYSSSIASGQYKTVTWNVGTNAGAWDLDAVRSFVWYSGSTEATSLNQFTKVYNAGTAASPNYYVVAVLTASAVGNGTHAASIYTVSASKAPTAQARGDFEDSTGGNTLDSIGIPEVNLELKSEPIVAKTRKLKAVWTPELAQDLNAYHSIDAEAELTALLSEYVSMEIDLEILDMLLVAAPGATTEAWSAKIGTEYTKALDSNGNASFTRVEDSASNRTAYVKSTWFQTLGNKIQRVSNKIHQLTLRGGANFMVCSPDVATILESIPGYVASTDGDSQKFAMGVSKVGSFASRFQVYKNPYMTENQILVGFRGSNFLETGAVYSPYIPLIQTPLVYDPVNFTPRRGVMTRYAKKVVRPEFYGRVIISDMNLV
jgi:hypothetical protein